MVSSQRYLSVSVGALGAVGSLLCSVTAWAVPADSLLCTFEVRDGSNNILASTEVSPQVARVPMSGARAPGFRETHSSFEVTTTLGNRGEFGAQVSYYTATDGKEGFQTGCGYLTFCSNNPRETCAVAACSERRCPEGDPYCDWSRVGLIDGVPQLDTSDVNLVEQVWRSGHKTYWSSLQCRHLGTYP